MEIADDAQALDNLTQVRFVHREVGHEESRAARAPIQRRKDENEGLLASLIKRRDACTGKLRPG